MIRDRNIEWLRQVRRIPVGEFGFYGAAAGPTTAVAKLTGLDDGAPLLDELGALGYFGGEIAAAGDSFTTLDLVTPTLIDVEQPIGVRVIWANNGAVATTDSVTWIVTYDQCDFNEALVAPSTPLDTAITTLQKPAATTTLVLKRTARGIINANKFDFTARQGVIAWNVEADAIGTFSADEIQFLGLEIDYMPLLCANRYEDIDVFAGLAATG
jgi:hypothetical protein